MPREDGASKALRLLCSGRVVVRTITDTAITADVRGDSAKVYRVVLDPTGWHDDCDSVGNHCSHIRAVQLVTLEPRGLQ